MENFTNSTNGTSEGFQTPPPPKPFFTNLLLPTVYLLLLIGSLYAFSYLYRQRQQARAARLEPWFPPHRQRDLYLSLLHLDPTEAHDGVDNEKKLSKVPDSVLKAALLQRALENIRRILELRTSKPALQSLLQNRCVSDDLWQRFLRAEQEMEAEVKDVVTEANAFAPNWGQVIFQSANEMYQREIMKQRTAEIQAQLEAEKTWWDKKRADIQSNFMRELEGDDKPADPVPKRNGNSEDDAVLVDAGGPAQAQGIGGGSGKKKKGKR